ncbi:MAG: hypothetical protein JXR23_06315 [Pontiellaceae bacterium]|nr:hypothetical protein [Pontiellaceae bacterium]
MGQVQDRINVLLSAYENDRNEERMRKNNLYAVFSTFVLLILGMVNAFLSKVDRCQPFVFSILGVCVLYSALHHSLVKDLNFVERCKKGREILIKSVVNNADIADDLFDDFEQWSQAKEFVQDMDDKDFPFFEFSNVKVKQSKHKEMPSIVWAIGIAGISFILGYQ